ncbi:MAG: bifunctional adenosylcobinamide kinase/adenosylcobinamide-phosphate guanylyltransferase [Actinomycetota bacterium]
MPVTVLTGPVASGKSRLASRMASAWSGPVVVVATAEPRDEEMRERIERHRAERPPRWTVEEVPLELGEAVDAADPAAFVIVDCLTLWTSNLLGAGVSGGDIVERSRIVAGKAAARPAPVAVVTNEVGWGIVPVNDIARSYRDLLGRVNTSFVDVADRALLVVAGRVLPLEPADPSEVAE